MSEDSTHTPCLFPIIRKLYQINWYRSIGDESLPSSVEIGIGRDKTPPPPAYLIADSSKTHLTKSFTIIHDSPQEVASYHLERTFGNETMIIKKLARPKTNRRHRQCFY
ncbi:MAG: hypothetical protein IPL23_30765 [Saprospiraceae bacterium]|nr:hypothetical protein [Saprospiraceae bacterium]